MNARRRPLARVFIVGACLIQITAAALQPFEVTVDAPPSLAAAAARVRAVNAPALETALSRAGLYLPPRVRVFLLASDDPRAQQVPSWIVGRTFGTDTIVIFPDRRLRYPYDSLDSVLLHEIVHLSLNVRAGGRPLPRWFHEGVAVSVESGWGIGSQARLLLAAARNPRIDDVTTLFAADAAPENETAYLLSAALIEDIRRRHGLEIPGAIAARVSTGEPFDVAFRNATGESADEAAAHAWRIYRGLRWIPVVTSATGSWGAILILAVIAFVIRLRRRRTKRWEGEDDDDDPPAALPPEDYTVH